MDSRALRQSFLDFFAGKGHRVVESSSLVPDKDPTLLFTNAGMVQFKEALALREDRGYTRAVSCQRCVRAGGKHNDLENVGYTARHHTFFEMLGNFSFGDYFKEEAIAWAWEYLTEEIGLSAEKLWVTVHEGDDEAEKIWVDKVGFDPERVTRLGDDDNFWTMGDTGPCGPSSEIYYDHGPEVPGGPPGSPESELDRYVEIWNLVFTQYDRGADGTLTPLPKPCVDTGMGVERLAAVLQKVNDNYEIDLLRVLVRYAAELLDCRDLASPSLKVIADHGRCATFLIADGVMPSNEGRGYVLRRIIRRALRHGHTLQSTGPFFHRMVAAVAEEMGEAYPIVTRTRKQIERVLLKEEEQFQLTLDQGMRILGDAIRGIEADNKVTNNTLPGHLAFRLYDTYGFPVDLTADIAREHKLTIDMDGFEKEMQAQRERARTASRFGVRPEDLRFGFTTGFTGYDTLQGACEVVALVQSGKRVDRIEPGDQALLVVDRTPFYAEAGGQLGDRGKMSNERQGDETGEAGGKAVALQVHDTRKHGDTIVHQVLLEQGRVRVGDRLHCLVDAPLRNATRLNHSATHLLHAALRLVLGEHINQRGSLVGPRRLRFDFSHFEPVSPAQLREIERIVNEQIRLNTRIETEVMTIDAAREKGALALFGEKYAEEVRVLTMGKGFSMELCGGTHAARTGDIGIFRVTSEQGIAAGVRRIEALTGVAALEQIELLEDSIRETAELLRTERTKLPDKVRQLLEQQKKLEKEVAELDRRIASGAGQDLAGATSDLGDFKLLVNRLDADPRSLPDALDRLKGKIGRGVVVLATVRQGKVSLIAGVTKDLTDRFDAVVLVNHIASQVGGRGGGRRDMARAGGSRPDALPAALASVEPYVRSLLRSS